MINKGNFVISENLLCDKHVVFFSRVALSLSLDTEREENHQREECTHVCVPIHTSSMRKQYGFLSVSLAMDVYTLLLL